MPTVALKWIWERLPWNPRPIVPSWRTSENLVAELIASESGLGYRIVRAQRFNQIDRIFAVLIVIALIGLAIDLLLRLLRDRVGRWT